MIKKPVTRPKYENMFRPELFNKLKIQKKLVYFFNLIEGSVVRMALYVYKNSCTFSIITIKYPRNKRKNLKKISRQNYAERPPAPKINKKLWQ